MKTRLALVIVLLVAGLLRLWRLSDVPVSLFGDELDVGYHAYSILKTGKDYSGNPWPLHFQSLAEWRTPLYLYASVPTVALFGISPLGVRLPAAIFGVLGVWGTYLLIKELQSRGITKKIRQLDTNYYLLPLIAAAIMAISPWHIQYSRAAFEVTMLLVFLIFGVYFFFKSLETGKYLWVSVALLVLTPLIYSTAKLFTLFLILTLFLLYSRPLIGLNRKYLVTAAIVGIVLGAPTVYATFFGGGTQRFNYISVFTDPVIETEVGANREFDARTQGEVTLGLQPTVVDRFFHNKVVFWQENIIKNILTSYSLGFLFYDGDINLRHSIEGMGLFYRIEAIPFILGLILFFASKEDKRLKALIAFFLLAGVIPASLTRDGGNHATRLILILPSMVFLIAYGLTKLPGLFPKKLRPFAVLGYSLLLLVNFAFYKHLYWVHNPWYSERWWHAGFKETFESVREVEGNYDKIVISNAGEPPWIFFAGWNEYPPDKWHEGYPFEHADLGIAFEEIPYIGKYYFGQVSEIGIYALGENIDDKTLYVAVAREVGANLIIEPGRVPVGLRLVKAVSYPSGEPAYYLFDKQK